MADNKPSKWGKRATSQKKKQGSVHNVSSERDKIP
jgi:hypothetical protein